MLDVQYLLLLEYSVLEPSCHKRNFTTLSLPYCEETQGSHIQRPPEVELRNLSNS